MGSPVYYNGEAMGPTKRDYAIAVESDIEGRTSFCRHTEFLIEESRD